MVKILITHRSFLNWVEHAMFVLTLYLQYSTGPLLIKVILATRHLVASLDGNIRTLLYIIMKTKRSLYRQTPRVIFCLALDVQFLNMALSLPALLCIVPD